MDTLPLYFSFALYGQSEKYWRGMLENIRLIRTEFPTATILVHYMDDVPSAFFKEALQSTRIILWRLCSNEPNKMVQRLLRLNYFEQGAFFIRDADSRVTARDAHCIRAFLASDKQYHAVRDHPYHKSRIMGGLFGYKKGAQWPTPLPFSSLFQEWRQGQSGDAAQYGLDEAFLRDIIFSRIKHTLLLQSDCIGHTNEDVVPIGRPLADDTDFVGNVYEIEGSQFRPTFRYKEHVTLNNLYWLKIQQQWRILHDLANVREIHTYPWDQRASILHLCVDACVALGLAKEASHRLAQFRWALVDDIAISKGNNVIALLRQQGWRIIASFDPERVAGPNEVVIVYGDYSHDVRYLPANIENGKGCIIYRHPLYFEGIKHSVVEFDPAWESVEQIYILNLRERKDRYMHQLVELCRVAAPLHRIFHYKAEKASLTGDRARDAYIGATKNHIDVVEDFMAKGYKHCLVLEDDFLFNCNYRRILEQIRMFFERCYTYDICFIGYAKQGEIRDYDDLLSRSYQACTTSSAYFLSHDTAADVHKYLRIGYEQMKIGGDPNIYYCDRYWAKLQPAGRFFVFRDKVGYQRIMHSDILNRTNYNFD